MIQLAKAAPDAIQVSENGSGANTCADLTLRCPQQHCVQIMPERRARLHNSSSALAAVSHRSANRDIMTTRSKRVRLTDFTGHDIFRAASSPGWACWGYGYAGAPLALPQQAAIATMVALHMPADMMATIANHPTAGCSMTNRTLANGRAYQLCRLLVRFTLDPSG
jgi:hypothetical protein